MQTKHQSVVGGDAATQGLDDLLARRLQSSAGQLDQLDRVGLSGDERLEHRAAALAQNVADDGVELDVGVFERLLDALHVPHPLSHQLTARAGQVA